MSQQFYQTPLEKVNVNVQRGSSVLQGLTQQPLQQQQPLLPQTFVGTTGPQQLGATTFLPAQSNTFATTSSTGILPHQQQQVFSGGSYSPLQSYSSGSPILSSGAPLPLSTGFVQQQQPLHFVGQVQQVQQQQFLPVRQEVIVNEQFREYGENVVVRVVAERSIFPERIEVSERNVFPEPMVQVRDIHTSTTEIEKDITHVYPVKLEREIVNVHPTLIEKEITHVHPTRLIVEEKVLHPEQIKHSVEERTHDARILHTQEQEVLPPLVQRQERQVYAQDFNLVKQQQQTFVSSPVVQAQSFVREAIPTIIPTTTTFVPTSNIVEEVPVMLTQQKTTTTTTEVLTDKELAAREHQQLSSGGITTTQNMVR